MGNALGSWIIVTNRTQKTIEVEISSVDNFDWHESPYKLCHGYSIIPFDSMHSLLQMNGNANGNPYTMTLHFDDGTYLQLRINQRYVDGGYGHEPYVEGGHTGLYDFNYDIDWQKWKIFIEISDSQDVIQQRIEEEEAERQAAWATFQQQLMAAHEEQQRQVKLEAARLAKAEAARRAKAEAVRKAKEEAVRKAKEEAVRKAKEEAVRKAKEEAVRKAKEEAVKKAKEEAVRKAKEEAVKKAKEEAARKAKEEALTKAKEVAAKKAKQEIARKAKEEASRKEKADLATAIQLTIESTELYSKGIKLAAEKRIEAALETFDQAVAKLIKAAANKQVPKSCLSNGFLKLIDAYIENGAYDEAFGIINKIKASFPENGAYFTQALEMIKTNNWSPDYMRLFLEKKEQDVEGNVISICNAQFSELCVTEG